MKVGMYVRTKRGQIGEIITIGKDNVAIEFNEMYQDIILKENIIKASFNIIDLIEAGDYANGYYVTTGNQNVGSIYIAEIDGLGLKKKLYNKDIKSIVTKEQFEQMSYEVSE